MLNLTLDITWVRGEIILAFTPSYKLKNEQSFTQRTFHALILRFIFVTDIQKLSNTRADFNFRVHPKGFNHLRSKTKLAPTNPS